MRELHNSEIIKNPQDEQHKRSDLSGDGIGTKLEVPSLMNDGSVVCGNDNDEGTSTEEEPENEVNKQFYAGKINHVFFVHKLKS